MIDAKTTLNLKPETVERLKKHKITKGESFNNVIVRLVQKYGNEDGKI